MKTVLVSAYAINPYKGSEDGTGWNYVLQIARYQKVIAITRNNNLQHIEKYQQEHPDERYKNIVFMGFDLPYWMRFWKKGGRGALPYFYMWQWSIPAYVEKRAFQYDLVHNLNFHNDWTPTFLWRLNKPLVWGPVGHHPYVPDEYFKHSASLKERVKNVLTWIVKKAFWTLDPFLKMAKKKSDKVICINNEVEDVMQLPESKIFRMFSVSSDDVPPPVTTDKKMFRVLSIGRLVSLKGFDVTLKSFHQFLMSLPKEQRAMAELVIIGKGPLKKTLEKYINKNNLSDHVIIHDWMDRADVLSYYKEASVFFFPSHEGAGMVVPEAMSYGVPILCFDNCGPGSFINQTCGIKLPYGTYQDSIVQFSEHLSDLFYNNSKLQSLSKGAYERFVDVFTWGYKGDRLRELYNEILESKREVA